MIPISFCWLSLECVYRTDNPHDLVFELVLVIFAGARCSLWVRQTLVIGMGFRSLFCLQISRQQQLVTRSPKLYPVYLPTTQRRRRNPLPAASSYGSITSPSLIHFLFCLVSEIPWVTWGARDRFTIAEPFLCFKPFLGLHKAQDHGGFAVQRDHGLWLAETSNTTEPRYLDNDVRFGWNPQR